MHLFKMIELRKYQKEIANECRENLARYRICYLAMEVRTGKTLTALEAVNYDSFKSVLFVTKKKAIPSILKDYESLKPCYKIEVVNYESLHKIENKKIDCVIADEAHKISAYPKPSKAQKQLKSIISENPFCSVIFLSGTPSPESYSQLFHQFDVSGSTPFDESSFYKWAKKYVNIKQRYVAHGSTVNDYSDAREKDIMQVLDKYFIRYTQTQAGFKNQVTEEVLSVKMSNTTETIIKRLLKDLVFEGKEKTIVADTGVKLQSKVHQLCSGTIKFDDDSRAIVDKSKALFIAKKFKGKKIAVFYKFVAERELLQEVFTNTTDTPEEFNSSDSCVFLGQMQSAREGINLSTADCIVFYNIDFSALSYWQCRDRMTSKTRTKENKVYWVFSSGGIEEKIYKRVLNKKDYTLNHFNRDYDRTGVPKQGNKTDDKTGLLLFETD